MRIVRDTNVVVSAFLSLYGAPSTALDLYRYGAFNLVLSEEILSENDAVLYIASGDRLVQEIEQHKSIQVVSSAMFLQLHGKV